MAKLKEVFEKDYQFTVVETFLDKNVGPQKQLNKHLAAFVADYDDEDTLLIVYYAGHGWSKKSKENGKEFCLLKYV